MITTKPGVWYWISSWIRRGTLAKVWFFRRLNRSNFKIMFQGIQVVRRVRDGWTECHSERLIRPLDFFTSFRHRQSWSPCCAYSPDTGQRVRVLSCFRYHYESVLSVFWVMIVRWEKSVEIEGSRLFAPLRCYRWVSFGNPSTAASDYPHCWAPWNLKKAGRHSPDAEPGGSVLDTG